MDKSALFDWLLTIIGSGGIGAAITYIVTIGSRKKKAEAEAEDSIIEVEQKKQNLKQDLYEYLLNTCDKYIKEYHELEGDFRKLLSELRELMDKLMLEKSQAISTKCSEIASLKSEISYLKGLRCYNFLCLQRIKENPNKQ